MEYVAPISCDQTDPERPYVDGCDASGQLGTRTPARFYNLVLAEGRNLVEGAGLTLDPLNDMQWLEAVQNLADTAAATAVAPVEGRVSTLETEVADLDVRTGVLESRATTLESRADSVEMRDDAIVMAAGEMPNPGNPNEVLDAILKLIRSEGVPTGSVQAFAQDTPPAGWLECDGRAVSRATYANLFAAIGTRYGNGNGSSTFNLPELRGEFVRGWDHGRGVDSLRNLGSYQSDEFERHRHEIRSRIITNFDNTGGSELVEADSGGAGSSQGFSNRFMAFEGGKETRPRNVALLYCIKA